VGLGEAIGVERLAAFGSAALPILFPAEETKSHAGSQAPMPQQSKKTAPREAPAAAQTMPPAPDIAPAASGDDPEMLAFLFLLAMKSRFKIK
jgi:hypothetical protein